MASVGESYSGGRAAGEEQLYEPLYLHSPDVPLPSAPRHAETPGAGATDGGRGRPAGEEIYTDKYGRVKVQFHWDREGKRNENSSCWIRVSHPWAGKGWGAVCIPRIGQEVIVDFLEGDPDQPIITGRVYNAEQMPPYGLPGSGMVSGIKSNSTKGGGGYNEMSMDDTKGKELITVHAQYDMATTVEHDQTDIVHNNRTTTIDVNDAETVSGNQTNHVSGNRTETVGGNETITIGGNRTETVGGNETITIGGDKKMSRRMEPPRILLTPITRVR